MTDGAKRIHVGHYFLRGVLGEGAMSTVYLAEHRATGRRVALKTLRLSLSEEEEARARLRLEARVLGRVRHRYLVDAIDAGALHDGAPFVVLEPLDGASLSLHITHGPLPVEAAMAVAECVLEALEALHAAGFVHRDVKPSNVVLHRASGAVVPKLIDLGVCLDRSAALGDTTSPRLTQRGAWVGTPSYMAPEQLDGREADERTDVYGVGALLYECLTGEPPYHGQNAGEVAARVLCEQPRPLAELRPDCPSALARLVARALAKDPAARPSSARALCAELRALGTRLALPDGLAALAALGDPRSEPPRPRPSAESIRASSSRIRARRARRALFVAVAAMIVLGAIAWPRIATPATVEIAHAMPPIVPSRPPSAPAPTRDLTPVLATVETASALGPFRTVVPVAPAPATRAVRAPRPRPMRHEPSVATQPDLDDDAALDEQDGGISAEPLVADVGLPPASEPSWEELEARLERAQSDELVDFDALEVPSTHEAIVDVADVAARP